MAEQVGDSGSEGKGGAPGIFLSQLDNSPCGNHLCKRKVGTRMDEGHWPPCWALSSTR